MTDPKSLFDAHLAQTDVNAFYARQEARKAAEAVAKRAVEAIILAAEFLRNGTPIYPGSLLADEILAIVPEPTKENDR